MPNVKADTSRISKSQYRVGIHGGRIQTTSPCNEDHETKDNLLETSKHL